MKDLRDKAKDYASSQIEDWMHWHERCREQVIDLMLNFNVTQKE